MTAAEQLVSRVTHDPYNEVSGHKVDGGVVLLLSHRITMDHAALVFVPDEKILFFDRADDEEAIEHINQGKGWPS